MAHRKQRNRAKRRRVGKKSRRSSRKGTLAGNLLLEFIVLVALTTMVFATCPAPSDDEARMKVNDSSPMEISKRGEFGSHLANLFRDKFHLDELFPSKTR